MKRIVIMFEGKLAGVTRYMKNFLEESDSKGRDVAKIGVPLIAAGIIAYSGVGADKVKADSENHNLDWPGSVQSLTENNPEEYRILLGNYNGRIEKILTQATGVEYDIPGDQNVEKTLEQYGEKLNEIFKEDYTGNEDTLMFAKGLRFDRDSGRFEFGVNGYNAFKFMENYLDGKVKVVSNDPDKEMDITDSVPRAIYESFERPLKDYFFEQSNRMVDENGNKITVENDSIEVDELVWAKFINRLVDANLDNGADGDFIVALKKDGKTVAITPTVVLKDSYVESRNFKGTFVKLEGIDDSMGYDRFNNKYRLADDEGVYTFRPGDEFVFGEDFDNYEILYTIKPSGEGDFGTPFRASDLQGMPITIEGKYGIDLGYGGKTTPVENPGDENNPVVVPGGVVEEPGVTPTSKPDKEPYNEPQPTKSESESSGGSFPVIPVVGGVAAVALMVLGIIFGLRSKKV